MFTEEATVAWVLATLDVHLVDDEVLLISDFFGHLEKIVSDGNLHAIDGKFVGKLKIVINRIRIYLRRLECSILNI